MEISRKSIKVSNVFLCDPSFKTHKYKTSLKLERKLRGLFSEGRREKAQKCESNELCAVKARQKRAMLPTCFMSSVDDILR